MLKVYSLILLSLVSLSCFASDYSYNVSGEDENGGVLEGTVYADRYNRDVSGELIDNGGNIHAFIGQWDGYGHIIGETVDGISVELDVN